jgi:FMN phosphatase YigB (HAD superfamily)
VKRKKHHKRKKWSIATLENDKEHPKSGREWSAVQALAKEIPHVVDLEEKLFIGERIYASQRVAYATINFLRHFLLTEVGIQDPKERDRLIGVYMDEFLHIKWFATPPELYPGAVEVLRRLKKEGVKTALVRNCSLHAAGQRTILSHFGWDDLFDVIVCASELESEKPSDLAYRTVVTELGMQELQKKQPEQFLFVGNETDTDIVGGTRMGWRTALLTTTEPTSRGLATHEASSWMQLANEVIWPRKFIKNKGREREMFVSLFVWLFVFLFYCSH